MARMTWHMGPFELKSLRLPRGKGQKREVFPKKWLMWKYKDVEKLVVSPSLTPTQAAAPDTKVIAPVSVVPVTQPSPPVITIPDQPATDNSLIVQDGSTSKTGKEVVEILSEFTCFPNLPGELRSKIWRHACFIPRNVNIWSWDFGKKITIPLRDSEDVEEGDVLVIWKLCSTTPTPAVLSTCTESRTEALRHYKLEFGTSYTFHDFTFTTHPRIYFNFAVDRLCMMESFEGETSRACKNFFERILTSGVRYLALNVKRFQDDPKRECTYVRPFLDKCIDRKIKTSLEHIMLVSPEYNREMRGTIDFKDSVELSGDSENINTSILKTLEQWVRNKEVSRGPYERDVPLDEIITEFRPYVDIEFKTLVINGRDCVD